MNGLEFAWRMSDMLVWPIVVLVGLVLYRGRVLDAFFAATSGRQLKRVKLGPVEAEWEATLEAAGRNVAGALSESASLPSDDDPIPTQLVDLIPLAATNPRRAIRIAFQQVLRALRQSYPQLADTSPEQLSGALGGLVRQGALDAETERAVIQLQDLLDLAESGSELVAFARAYQFLSLAEGAIHAVLRGVAPANGQRNYAGPVRPSWRGIYNNDYLIELTIQAWEGDDFRATMAYPASGTTTEVTGRVQATEADGVVLVWNETGYLERGGRTVRFDGQYRATIAGDSMTGAWYDDRRFVAAFQMSAMR